MPLWLVRYASRQYGQLIGLLLPLEEGEGRHLVCRCWGPGMCQGRVMEEQFQGPVLRTFQV